MVNIRLAIHPELINPKLKMEEARKIIKNITGIKEEDQIFQVVFYISGFDEYFWNASDLIVYDQSKYKTKIIRGSFEQEVILNLHKKVEILKKMINEQTKIPIERQEFHLNKSILNNEMGLVDQNLFKYNKFNIKISKELNDILLIKYPNNNNITKIKTDLYNTGFELLEQIHNNSYSYNILDLKYYLYYKNKNLNLDEILINLGIKNGDIIELIERKTFKINFKPLSKKEIILDVGPYDTIKFFKKLVQYKVGTPISVQQFLFEGKKIEGNLTLSEYNIKNNSTIESTLILTLPESK